jgi:hypothetical protein
MANSTVNIDIKVQSKSLQDLEQELEDINAQLKEVPVGSQAFADLSKQAQGVTKELDKANAAVEGMTLEKKVRASQGAVTGLAGGLEATVGTLGLLGVESEAFGKFEEKALSAIAASRGFIDIADGVGTVVENVDLATVKAKIFGITTKQAIIATGIGIFVVALGTVVAYWDEITAGIEEFGEKVPFVGKAIQVVKDGFDALVDAFRPVLEFLGILPDEVERANMAMIASNEETIKSAEREIALLQAQGAAAEEVYEKIKELLEAELDNLKRNEADKEEIYKKETELLVLEQEERTRIAKEEEEKRTQILEDEAEKREAIEQEYTDLYQGLQDKLSEIAEKTEEELLKIEKEGVLNRIKELDIEDERIEKTNQVDEEIKEKNL